MKFSLNSGPYVGSTDFGFKISTEHIRKIVDFLLEWKDSLPDEIANHIQIVTIKPERRVNCPEAVSLAVILNGGEAYGWEAKFEQNFAYLPNEVGINITQNQLTNGVRRALELELNKYQLASNRLGSMVGKLEVRY